MGLRKLFRFIKLAENAGFGFDKMIDGWKSYSDKEVKFEGDDDFSVSTFYLSNSQNAPVNAPINAPVNAPLNQLQNSILKEIVLNSKISYDELADKLDRHRTTIMRNIQRLKSLELIERVGSNKSGYWRVK